MNKAIKTILDIVVNVINYIIDFIFDWEDDVYEEKDFIANEKVKHAVALDGSNEQTAQDNATNAIKSNKNARDFEMLQKVFGLQSAEYIYQLREEVDHLVEKHGLVRENTFVMAITPEQLRASLLTPDFFERTIERVYSQYNKDVIIKPGNINIKMINRESFYAEIQIETYMVTEEVLTSI